MMSKKKFIELFDVAEELGSRCIYVEISAEGIDEVIVIPNKSFKSKREFYKSTYDKNLCHVMNKDVKIVGFSHGDTLDLQNHIY